MGSNAEQSPQSTLLVLQPKPFKPFKSKDEYLYAMKEDLSEWFFCLYRIHISVENFFEVLETGIVLCDHAVSVQNFARERRILHADLELRSYFIREIPDDGIPCKYGVKPKTFQARDNVSNFITWCRKLGIPQVLLFETDDLVLRKNERSVVLCLLEVARIGAKLGMLAPVLVQMEEEIDAELAGEPPPQIKTCDLRSLDEMVRALVGRCTCPSQFPIIRIADGKYQIGDSHTLIFVRILRNHVMVRVGGGWDTLENYLDKHDPCRCAFRGHRNSPGPDQVSRAKRKTSSSSQVSRPKTPTSIRKNTNNSIQRPVTPAKPSSYRARSPSPGNTLRAKSPLFTTPQNRSDSHHVEKQPGNVQKKAHNSSIIVNSAARNGMQIPRSLRSSSPSLSTRVMSPSPSREIPQSNHSRSQEICRPKTPSPRGSSPGVENDAIDYPDSNNRSISSVQGRTKSPGIPKFVYSPRQTASDMGDATMASRRSRSPGPVRALMEAASKRPNSPNNRSFSPSSLANGVSPLSTVTAKYAVDEVDVASETKPASRAKTPTRRCPSPCRIPRPKTPLHSSSAPVRDSIKQEQTGYVDKDVKVEQDKTLSGNAMDTPSSINIDTISTMTLSEFKNLLNTSLSVPKESSTQNHPDNSIDSTKSVSTHQTLTKTETNHRYSPRYSKPPSTPKRAKSVTNLVSGKDMHKSRGLEERVRRSLPQSPVDPSKTLANGLDSQDGRVLNVHNEISSVEVKGTPSRPVTPSSSVSTRLPRPKTPTGIPRPSTPVHNSKTSIQTTRSTLKENGSAHGEENLRSSSSSLSSFNSRAHSPSPDRTARQRIRSPSPQRKVETPSGRFLETSNNIRATCDTKDYMTGTSKAVLSKPSRLRPPSPSRVLLAKKEQLVNSVQTSNTRGRQPARTLPTPQYRKRPSSAGPVVVASGADFRNGQQETDSSGSTKNSNVKKYFGRKNAKTIIKANSLSKAKSIQNIDVDSAHDTETKNQDTKDASVCYDDRSRSRLRGQISQTRPRPKSAGPRPLVRQEAVDNSSIIVNRGDRGQHRITVSSGDSKTYQSNKRENRPSSAKSLQFGSFEQANRNTKSARELSKSLNVSGRRSSLSSEQKGTLKANETGVCPKMKNKYVSANNIIQAWEEKASNRPTRTQRQLPTQPRRSMTPGPGTDQGRPPRQRTRSMTPNPIDDEEFVPRPLEEIKAALQLPVNGVNKIEVDPHKLAAPPEDAEMFQKMEELFHIYREKELSSGDIVNAVGPESSSNSSEEFEQEQVSADDEAESVDSNANLMASQLEPENYSLEKTVHAQLDEMLKPKPRKESGLKSRIPGPKSQLSSLQKTRSDNADPRTDEKFYNPLNGMCPAQIDCDMDQMSFDLYENRSDNSNSVIRRDDSSTSLSDLSVSSSQCGYRGETPVPKLATPLCTGRSTLVSLRKERSSSTSSVNGGTSGRLVRAVSLDHSFTSTGNSLVDTSFSLAEDEDYV